MEFVYGNFRKSADKAAKGNIYFWDEVEKYIYDANGNIRYFDEDMLEFLKQYADKFFNTIYAEAKMISEKNMNLIKDGDFSDGVKKLADAYMHESLVSFNVENSHLIAHFGDALYHRPMMCRFHTVSDNSFNVVDCEINGSEVAS